jgi:zinc protease
MKRWLGAALIAATAAAPAVAQQITPPGAVHDTTLANGLQIYVIENHTAPLVTVGVVVHDGAMTQDSDMTGLPALYGHLMAGERTFHRDLDYMRGILRVTNGTEFIGYFVTIPAPKYDDGLSLLARMIEHPDFNGDLLRMMQVAFPSVLERTLAHPEVQLQLAVEEQLWSTAWGRKNFLGSLATIETATPKLFETQYRRYYVPNNAAVVVSGDISTTAVFAAARHAFDGWRRGPDPFVAYPIPPIPALGKSHAVILTGAGPGVTVYVEWQGPSVGQTPDLTYAADVFTTLFNDPASHAQQSLVASGLFQDLAISYTTQRHGGLIKLVGRTTADALPRALPALGQELAACAVPGAFSDDALTASRRSRRLSLAMTTQTAASAAQYYGSWWGVADADYYRGYPEHIDAVTAGDVNAYVVRYIEKPYVIGVVGPTDATASVRAFAGEPASGVGP